MKATAFKSCPYPNPKLSWDAEAAKKAGEAAKKAGAAVKETAVTAETRRRSPGFRV